MSQPVTKFLIANFGGEPSKQRPYPKITFLLSSHLGTDLIKFGFAQVAIVVLGSLIGIYKLLGVKVQLKELFTIYIV